MLKPLVSDVLIEALREVQVLGGHPWAELAPTDKIIGTLAGFDSLTGIEATVLVELKLAAKLERPKVSLGRDSIFVSDDGTRALRTHEVVSKVCALLESTR